ncbi:hypothetical protein LSTR_LSTR017470 [Laodelphax striatellus]|uniref:Large ribosomal subunit protein eL33 n=1 Tax=Laodelphax striatellus TaxID=195883 RepID=A0A482XQ31_LAOST|nr:hypothetical protein LSTR_LSTR017470 [Laodelphax striatellus]
MADTEAKSPKPAASAKPAKEKKPAPAKKGGAKDAEKTPKTAAAASGDKKKAPAASAKPAVKHMIKKRHGRLYAKAVFTGFKRGLRNQHENTALLKVQGCEDKPSSWYYVGKKCVFVYKVSGRFGNCDSADCSLVD